MDKKLYKNLRDLLRLEQLMGMDFIPAKISNRGAKLKQKSEAIPHTKISVVGASDNLEKEFIKFRDKVLECTRCHLHKSRTQVVFGVGNIKAPIVFVGEAPGYEEDIQGEPFVGRAGRLLTQALKELRIARNQVYIANILKCRPPENRLPRIDEIVNCVPYLIRQIEFIKPQVVCALGGIAAQTLLSTQAPMKQLKGKIHDYNNMKIFPIFHPAYILRNPIEKNIFEEDLKSVCKIAGLI